MLMINANSTTNSVLHQEGGGHSLRHRNMISWQVVLSFFNHIHISNTQCKKDCKKYNEYRYIIFISYPCRKYDREYDKDNFV
jgi:hypothetical protein